MNLKKLLYLSIIEIIFFALIITALIFVRYQQKIYIDELQLKTPEIARIQEDLQKNNITGQNQESLQQTVLEVEKITNKSLLMTKCILPAIFILLFILFQIIYWHFAVKTPWKRIILPAIIQAALVLIISSLLLDFLSYLLYGEGTQNPIYLILVFILLILVTLFNFYYFIAEQPFLLTLRKFLFSELKIWLNIIATFVLLGITIFLTIITYVFTQVDLSITAPVILLIVFIIFANIQRIYLIDKLLVEKIKRLMKETKVKV